MRASAIFIGLTCISVGCEAKSFVDPSEIGSFARVEGVTASKGAPMDFRAATPPASASPALAAPEAQPTTATLSQRMVVYSASLRLVVSATADAMASVQSIARDVGGYLQESDARSITVRVPAEKFETSVAAIEKLGEVVERAVKASDVSEQMLDLDVRLDNARAARDRLKSHLAKSEKMEDTIKLEVELSRVTTQIELLEGKRRLLSSQIAMSTIRVELNAARPQTTRGEAAASPFPWVARLGDGLVAGAGEAMPQQPRFLAAGPKFDPPGGFVRYFSAKPLVEAMNADGVRIKVQRFDNYDRAPLEFWRMLARRSLVETRALSITDEGSFDKLDPMSTLAGTREVAGKRMSYLLALSRTNDHVYAFEAWGPSGQLEGLMPALVASARSLKR